jgi:hypothetical protein
MMAACAANETVDSTEKVYSGEKYTTLDTIANNSFIAWNGTLEVAHFQVSRATIELIATILL